MSEMQLKIVLDDASFRRVSDEMASIKNGATKAITAAINRTVKQLKVKVVDVISTESGIKKTIIRPRVKEYLSNYTTLRGAVRILNYNIPAHKISASKRPNPRGDYSIRKIGGKTDIVETPFKNLKLGNGVPWFVRYGPKRQVERLGGEKNTPWYYRLSSKQTRMRQPIYKIYALSPRIHLEKSGKVGEVTSAGQAIFMKNLESQVNRFLNRPKEAASGNPGT